MVSAFGRAGKQITIKQRLDLYMPDQQLERVAGGKVLDPKSQDAIDGSSFETPGTAMEKEFERHEDNPQKKMCDRQERADKPIIESSLFFVKNLINVVGEVRKVLHCDRHALCMIRIEMNAGDDSVQELYAQPSSLNSQSTM
jgi:hypothetical protein